MQSAEFSELVIRFSYSLKPFALSLTRDMEEAKNLLHETVYTAIARQDQYPEEANLKAWLYIVMKNIYTVRYRHTSRLRPAMAAQTEPPIETGQSPLPEIQKINAEVGRLKKAYRTPFLMHYKGFKYHEIADQLSLSVSTVKSRIQQARKQLLRKMRND